jgi:hypothetical protein
MYWYFDKLLNGETVMRPELSQIATAPKQPHHLPCKISALLRLDDDGSNRGQDIENGHFVSFLKLHRIEGYRNGATRSH